MWKWKIRKRENDIIKKISKQVKKGIGKIMKWKNEKISNVKIRNKKRKKRKENARTAGYSLILWTKIAWFFLNNFFKIQKNKWNLRKRK